MAEQETMSQAAEERAQAATSESEPVIADLRSQLQELSQQISEKAGELANSKAEAAELGVRVTQLQASLTGTEQNEKALNARLSDLLHQNADLEASFASQQEAIVGTREQDHAEVAALQLEVAALNEKLQSLTSERAQLEEERAAAGINLREEASKHQQQLSELSSLAEGAEKDTAELRQLQSSLKDKESLLSALTAELAASKEALSRLKGSKKISRPRSGSSSPAASRRSSEEAVSEESSADASERSRGTSVKEIQQQHVFELNSQLQALEQRNHKLDAQLKEAVAAKEELQKHVAELKDYPLTDGSHQTISPEEDSLIGNMKSELSRAQEEVSQ